MAPGFLLGTGLTSEPQSKPDSRLITILINIRIQIKADRLGFNPDPEISFSSMWTSGSGLESSLSSDLDWFWTLIWIKTRIQIWIYVGLRIGSGSGFWPKLNILIWIQIKTGFGTRTWNLGSRLRLEIWLICFCFVLDQQNQQNQ